MQNPFSLTLLNALGEGVYSINTKGECTYINERALSLLGYSEDEVLGKDQHELFHHHKIDGTQYTHQECPVSKTLHDGVKREMVDRFIHKNGDYIDVRVHVTPIIDEQTKQITGAVVAFSDIREYVKTENQLRAEHDLFNQGPVAIFIWEVSNEWPICFASSNVINIFGYAAEDMLKPDFHYTHHIHPDDFVKTMVDVRLNMAQSKPKWEQVYRFYKADGSLIWLHHYTSAEFSNSGKITRLLGYVIDVTNQKNMEAELIRAATIDTLTGALNRGELMKRLESEFVRVKRSAKPLSVLMIDIDHFKTINDTYGHAVGDEALKQFSQIVQNLKRESDSFGRIGGEEFILMLPETSIEGAQIVAEKLCRVVSQNRLVTKTETIQYTVSIGVAVCDKQLPKTVDELLHDADMGLYQAKEMGRNRVVTYYHPQPAI
jgi:diguanylate cyclase (GGDEF)-like protein/PAS domain S-box-containing protein